MPYRGPPSTAQRVSNQQRRLKASHIPPKTQTLSTPHNKHHAQISTLLKNKYAANLHRRLRISPILDSAVMQPQYQLDPCLEQQWTNARCSH
jgi:hypothetical protein